MAKDFNPENHVIFECLTGSRLYGTYSEDSDYDYRAVCLPPLNVLVDPFMNFNVKDSFEGEDRAIYDLGKFMSLCSQSNPNIVELLFIPPENIVSKSPIWDMIVENKNLFLSKKAKYTFTGYSVSQINSLIRHREWFFSPPSHKPTREEFGLSQSPIASEGNLQNVLAVNHELFKDEFKDELIRERNYRDTKKQWDNYVQWRDNRNPKRKASEEKIGYDGKYAMHAFRLMKEGQELLLTGRITFPSPDAEFLLAIKNGEYTFEEILSMSNEADANFQKWYDNSVLPKSPNIGALKKLYFNIAKEYCEWDYE